MKKTALLSLLLMTTLAFLWGDLSQNLLGRYLFSGDAQDSSGNGNHGTVYGAALTTDRFGQANSAYYFNDTRIGINSVSWPAIGYGDFTMATWIKPQLIAGDFRIILCDQALNNFQFNLANATNGGIEAYIAGGGINSGAQTWELNQWYHVVIMRTNGMLKFYRDDSMIFQFNMNQSIGQSTSLSIGRRTYYVTHSFMGCIDDLYIWNRALTADEIHTLYMYTGISFDASTTTPYVGESVQFTSMTANDPVAWHWDFNSDGIFDSESQNPIFTYYSPGTYSVYLKVDYSTYSDSVIVTDFITVSYCPPAEPENVQVLINYPHAVVTWDPVTTNLLGVPITPSGYIVLFSEDLAQEVDSFYYLCETPDTSYSHYRVAEFTQNMFYAVKAYIAYDRDTSNYLEELRNSGEKTPWSEIKTRLY